ncbi:DoxX family protein [Dyadobacter arcticus]|uniref:Membrane protein n=1 Tax=Dyadobacter arcticus TaxID=1078754 RepID=A0ABX0ULX3_9BACT|nr:MauE/DoxX family redox-associated membrane protein [Dyadobacter arcticus]NIJ53099.1 putative membrane protein [Dyadobacter arcticus]
MKEIALYFMASLYMLAGTMHFIRPKTFLRIMPHYMPHPLQLVYLSGFCEIIFGLMLIIPNTRHFGAWLIIALLIAVFPANIQMTIDFYHHKNPYLWVTILRLPLQFVLIWWAWLYTR